MAGADTRVDWRLLLIFFGLTAATLVVRATSGNALLLNDTDDAMRLVEVRDLLAGQGWYDLNQYRLDTPYASSMHWSRLVDLPIALLILAARPFLGGALAETFAAYTYPLLMLLGLLWLSARLSLQLAGREGLLPGVALPAFSLVVFADFAPGRFDHHSVQIVLLLATLSCAIGALERPREAIGAGVASALALAIGIESLPTALAAILAFGLAWGLDGRHARAMCLFGIGFAATLLAAFAATVDPALWFQPVCDALSLAHVLAAAGTGLVLVLLSVARLEGSAPALRLAAGVAAGAALAGVLAALFPDCLRGPYAAMDPWLVRNWLDRIEEAKPALAALFEHPDYVAAVMLPPLLAAGVIGERLVRSPRDQRPRWVAYAAFLGLALLVALIQVRGARMAMSLSAPAGAVLVVAARSAFLRRPRLSAVAGLVIAWLGFAGVGLALATQLLVGGAANAGASASGAQVDRDACRRPEAFATLAAQPRQRIMGPIDLGAHLLAFTPHEVVAAPYHRDQRGVRDSMRFFTEPLETGRSILVARGITEVVVCAGLPELAIGPSTAADAFMPLLEAGRLPDWLVEISDPAAPLRIFVVEDSDPEFRPDLAG